MGRMLESSAVSSNRRALLPSEPGSLTLDVMRPVLAAVERGDPPKVRTLCQIIVKAINQRIKALKKDQKMIEDLTARYSPGHRK